MVLVNNGTFYLKPDATLGPTFLQNMSQVSGSVISSIAMILGVNPNNFQLLISVMAVLTFSIPLLAGLVVLTAMQRVTENRSSSWVMGLFVLYLLLTGYLSRIWVCGWLSSNIGTLSLIALTSWLAIHHSEKLVRVLLMSAICIHVYPLFAPLVGVVCLIYLFDRFRIRSSTPSFHIPKVTAPAIYVAALVTAGLLLPVIATRRSYGADQYLAEGGIEPFPFQFFTLFSIGILCFMTAIGIRSRDLRFLTPVGALVLLCGVIAVHSHGAVGQLAYYPSKILIAAFMLILLLGALATLRYSSSADRPVAAGLVSILFLAFTLTHPPQQVFVGTFMGELPSVLRVIEAPDTSAVSSKQILRIAELGTSLESQSADYYTSSPT